VDAAARDRREIVWHPELNVYFGVNNHIWRHVDMESEEFDILSLAAGNCWTSLCVVSRDLVSKLPYPATDLANRIGFEDWSWYRNTIEAGAIHKIVKGTGHAVRTKAISLVKQTSASGAIPSPTNLFRRILREKEEALSHRSVISPGSVTRNSKNVPVSSM
jgi:hypothetical protein